jgi:hypothetical protein
MQCRAYNEQIRLYPHKTVENMKIGLLASVIALNAVVAMKAVAQVPPVEQDWLISPAPFKAKVVVDDAKHDLILQNGLTSRTIRISPNAATTDYRNLITGEQMLRVVGPEARVTLDGTEYAIGGLEGQPIQNYILANQIDALYADASAYRFSEWKEEPAVARFPWKKRPEWMSTDLPWPAPGKSVVLRFVPPGQSPSKMTGQVLFEESFQGKLDASWKVRVSDKNPRSSFSNEGKAGEIYTPADTAVYAERTWPAGASTVEVKLDTGDDTQSNAWGPGIALMVGKTAAV